MKSSGHHVHQLGESSYVKHGTNHEVHREIEAMEFVRQHTSIPVPSVLEVVGVSERNPDNPNSWFSMSITMT